MEIKIDDKVRNYIEINSYEGIVLKREIQSFG